MTTTINADENAVAAVAEPPPGHEPVREGTDLPAADCGAPDDDAGLVVPGVSAIGLYQGGNGWSPHDQTGDQGAEGVSGAGGGSGGVFVWRRCVVKRRGAGVGAGAPESTDSGLIDVEWGDAAGGEVRINGSRVSSVVCLVTAVSCFALRL